MDNYFIQYTGQTRNHHSVVSYGDMLCAGMGNTVEYILTIEHTGPAVDNQVVSGQVFWEVTPGDEVYLQSPTDTLPQQAGNFDLPDVLGQRSMGTSSAISTRDCAVRQWIAAAPSTKSWIFPL